MDIVDLRNDLTVACEDDIRSTIASWLRQMKTAEEQGPDEELAGRFAGRTAELLLGAVVAHVPRWQSAEVYPDLKGGHCVRVVSEHEEILFSSNPDLQHEGVLSPSLAQSFGREATACIHVWGHVDEPPFVSPTVRIGAPPPVRLLNVADGLTKVRAVANLPSGAALIRSR